MKIGIGKGQFDDYLTTEERAKVNADNRRKVGRKPVKSVKPRRCGK